jgi:hypothetical protein
MPGKAASDTDITLPAEHHSTPAPVTQKDNLQQQFRTTGFVHMPALLDRSTVLKCLKLLRDVGQLEDRDADAVIEGSIKGYLSPGMVCRDKRFWPLVTAAPLLDVAAQLLGPAFKFCICGDVGFAHRSGYPFHRDTVIDTVTGPSWDPQLKEYGLVRAITCFHESRSNLFAVSAGSHLPATPDGYSLAGPPVQWIRLQPGDVVFFDARIRHSGKEADFPKYGVILTYGKDNDYTQEYYFYRRLVQLCGLYEDPPTELIDLLKTHGLFQDYVLDPHLLEHYTHKFADLAKRTPEHGQRYRLR